MKILITGNLGYLGSCLVPKLLEAGHFVVGYDNCTGRTTDTALELCKNPKFEFIKGDVLDVNKIRKIKKNCDFVIHLAAMVGEPVCNKHEEYSTFVNAKGTDNVCRTGPNLPIIFASTGSVYGKVSGVCIETSPCNPLSVYAKAKLQAEQYIKDEDNYIIYRFATAYGLSPALRLDLLPNDFCYRAWKDKSLVVSQPEFRRTFCHVRDICDAMVFGVANFEALKNQTFNVGNVKGNWTKRQLCEFIKSKVPCSVFYDENVYKDTDCRDYETSYQKINEKGWCAKVTMEEGLDELLKAMPLINITSQYHQKL